MTLLDKFRNWLDRNKETEIETDITQSQPVADEIVTPSVDPEAEQEEIIITGSKPTLQKVEGLSLVSYSPEELLLQIHQENERVDFGMSRITKSMHVYGEIWSFVGPIILLLGTVGEIFIVLWTRQKNQEIWAGLSIVAVALVLEGTFLAVSYKAALIRNRADKRPGGATELDRRKLRRQLAFWLALAFGVCATQIIFIIAQTLTGPGLGQTGIVVLAIARSVFTVIADAYTAFAHEEMPTTSERALEEKEQQAKHTKQSLDQKIYAITTINQSQLGLRRAQSEAQIDDEDLQTRLEMARLQNKALLGAMVAQQESSNMMLQTGSGMIRALFDTNMDESQRLRMLTTMQGFMGAVAPQPQPQLLPGYVYAKIAPDLQKNDSVTNVRSKSCGEHFEISLDNPTLPLPRLELHPDVTTSVIMAQPATQPATQPAQPGGLRTPSSDMAKDVAVLYAKLLEEGMKPNKTAMAKQLKTTRQNVANHMKRLGLVL